MKKTFIKPAKSGSIVRFPGNPKRVLKKKGEEVEQTTFWTRRILDGSVIDTEAEKKKAEEAKNAKNTKGDN